jgi:hypothetical protein
MLAAGVANSLADVVVTATSARIAPLGGPADAAGRVIVVQGATTNDTIRVLPNATRPGAVDVVLNKQTSVFDGPISAIVVHGVKGNDSVTIDPRLAIDAFLFSGTGKSVLTGGGGDDVLVGGGSGDVLSGGTGRDVLIAGTGNGTIVLYGNAPGAGGAADGENVLVAGGFAQQYSLPWLRDVGNRWTSGEARAARVAAVQAALLPALRTSTKPDALYKGNTGDLIVASAKDQVWNALACAPGHWISAAYQNSGGFTTYNISSPWQRGVTNFRVLLPAGYSASPATPYRVIYVLPVEQNNNTTYGDGLSTVRSLGLQNSKNTIFVAPSFSDLPWYCDHSSNSQIWQESYFCRVVVPAIESMYPVLARPEGRLLLGFSKSGYGAFSLLLRHLDMFGRAYAWDAPFAMTTPLYGFGGILGSSQNFANYRMSTLLANAAPLLRGQPPRLFLEGYGIFQSDLRKTDQLMTQLGIPHVYLPGRGQTHRWQSAWVNDGVNLLLS